MKSVFFVAVLLASPLLASSRNIFLPTSELVTTVGTQTAAAGLPFSDSALFERLSHFKDYGVPGTVHDPVNKAAIADGSCRLFGIHTGGYTFWNSPARVARVITALASLPSTSQPSHFVLTARRVMPEACQAPVDEEDGPSMGCVADNDVTAYNFTVVKSSIQNWYHALCDKEWAVSPDGDPAYQPQQMALTTGFVCIVAGDCSGSLPLSAAAMQKLAAEPALASQSVCDALPSNPFDGAYFSQAASPAELSDLAAGLLAAPCWCDPQPPASKP